MVAIFMGITLGILTQTSWDMPPSPPKKSIYPFFSTTQILLGLKKNEPKPATTTPFSGRSTTRGKVGGIFISSSSGSMKIGV